MNKAQALAATRKALAVNPHRAVMVAFVDGAQVTLLGEHIPAPRWVSEAVYVAYKGGKEVARSEYPPVPAAEQDAQPESVKLVVPPRVFKRSTWDQFEDLGVTLVDRIQDQLPQESDWEWWKPCGTHRHVGHTRYDVLRRDGLMFAAISALDITWGNVPEGVPPVSEIIRFRPSFGRLTGSFKHTGIRVFFPAEG